MALKMSTLRRGIEIPDHDLSVRHMDWLLREAPYRISVLRALPSPEAIALLKSLGGVNNHNCVSCE